MSELNETLTQVTDRIRVRSRDDRRNYLARLDAAATDGPHRQTLSCTNLAHAFAASPSGDKHELRGLNWPNIGIVSAYNDMLSAHQPLGGFPEIIRWAAREAGATAQFAGGVPAMCDGITQGQPGMELSLFSRDVIAMATAVALSHNAFDAGLCLGVCDKIVPGLLIGALTFGHLPFVFVPGGPMPSGLPNREKSRIRQQFARGEIGREALLNAESQAYHAPGTCTFYGTANSNQMLMEVMGLHLPGSAFVNPNTSLRNALTGGAARRVAKITALGDEYIPIGHVIDERAIANAVVGLLATGGSTNHTLHLIAIARAAGIRLTWDDFSDLSRVVPLLTRIYPNGAADVNHFHAAGGMGLLIRELLDAGLLHPDVLTVMGQGLDSYTREPWLSEDGLAWRDAPRESMDRDVLAPVAEPFRAQGGIQVLSGNLGRAVLRTTSVALEHQVVEAPAIVFDDQAELLAAFKRGELDRDFVGVVRFQGPSANGMPELHKLSPELGVLQDRGFRVALVTDGRMSGASGKVPAALHVTPESAVGGPLAQVRNGDLIRLDGQQGILEARVPAAEWAAREPAVPNLDANHIGMGRELFGTLRAAVSSAEDGACSILPSASEPMATRPHSEAVR